MENQNRCMYKVTDLFSIGACRLGGARNVTAAMESVFYYSRERLSRFAALQSQLVETVCVRPRVTGSVRGSERQPEKI